MSDYTTQVGMDVHARSISCKALCPSTGECLSKTVSGEGVEAELLSSLAPAFCLRCGRERNMEEAAVN